MMQNVYKNLNAFFFRLPLLWFLGLSYFTFTPLFAQSVSPDGSLQYDVAIEVPKGAGPTPPLRISYNSNSRNGMLGVGFRLEGLPVITRGNFGRGINYDGNDTYFGPGGRLILQGSASAQPRVYLPQNYNGSRYLAYGSCGDGPCYWVEESGGGAKQYFGTSDIAGSNEQGRAIAVANPAGQAGSVREWALGRVEDSQGRYFEVEWEVDEGMQYPVKITYTKGPSLSQYHTVNFVYDKTGRPDQEVSYGQSARVQTRWRLNKVMVESERPILWGLFRWASLVREYELKYEADTFSSKLAFLKILASNGSLIDIQHFHWHSREYGFSVAPVVVPARDPNHFGKVGDGLRTVRYGDFNGDGKNDIIWISSDGSQWYAYLSTGNGFNVETWAVPARDPNHFGRIGDGLRHLLSGDFNGDGKSDLLWASTDKSQWYAYLSTGNGFNVETWAVPARDPKHFGIIGDGLRHLLSGDFNGDGKSDLLWVSTDWSKWYAYLSTGNGFNVETWAVPARDPNHFGKIGDGLRHLLSGDFNGDGKIDLLWASTDWSQWYAYLSTGNGFNVENWAVPARDPSVFGKVGDGLRQLETGDFNGDGKSDLVWVSIDKGHWYAYLSTGNGFNVETWAVPTRDKNLYSKIGDGLRGLFQGDFNGDGKSDLLLLRTDQPQWFGYFSKGNGFSVKPLGVPARDPSAFGKPGDGFRFLLHGDFKGNGKTDLTWVSTDWDKWYQYTALDDKSTTLKSITNRHLSRVEVSYSLSSKVSSLSSCPDNLPTGYGQACGNSFSAPRQLVSNIKTYAPVGAGGSDQLISDTSYFYENARFFPGKVYEQALLGFGKITQKDNLRNRKVESTYRQDRRFAGLPLEQKSFIGNKLVSRASYGSPKQFRCDDNGCVEDNTLVLLEPRQVRPGKTTAIEYDSLSGSGQVVQITKSKEVLSYDFYGNPTESVESIDANGSRKAIRQVAEYINKPSSPRRMGLPYYQKKCLGSCIDEDILEESYIYFDNQPAGLVGEKAQVTRRESLKAGVRLGEELRYNANGQLSKKVNDAGIFEEFEYDSFGHLSKTTVTSGSKSIVREQKIDPRYGSMPGCRASLHSPGQGTSCAMLWTKDENGIIAENDLDERGRVIENRLLHKGKTLQRATAHYETESVPFRVRKCRYYGENLAFSSCETVISDALGRKIYEITPSPQDAAGALVAVKTEYDSLGRAYRVSEPYVSDINGGGNPQRWNTSTFDSRGRVVSVTSADGKTSRTVYNPALVGGSVSSQEITGPHGNKKRSFMSLSGQPVLIQEAYGSPQQAELKYTYDKFDRLIQVEAPQGITQIEYDALGRQRFIKDPHAGMTEYSYIDDITSPAYGSLLTEKRPAPNAAAGSSEMVTVRFEYNDPWGRLTRKTRSSGSVTQYVYDESDMSFSANKLTSVEHKANGFTITDRFSYDVYGEIKTSSRRFAHASWDLCKDADALPCFSVVSRETDSLGRVTSFNYPDGSTGELAYLREFSLPTAMKHEGKIIAKWSNYNFRAQTGKVEYANGIETTWNYRADNGLLRDTKTSTTGGTSQTLLHQEYSFDNAFNISKIENKLVKDLSVSFTYDKHNRLQTATRKGEVRNYKFDENSKGNLLERRNLKLVYDTGQIRPSSTQIRDHSTAPPVHWVNSESFGWSAGGNLRFRNQANNSWEYQYDTNNMMTKAVDAAGNETLFFYDASGQRFLKVFRAADKTKSEMRTWYLSDGYELREQYAQRGSRDKVGEQATLFFRAGERFASQTGKVSLANASINYLVAGMFSGGFLGIAQKIYYLGKGSFYDLRFRFLFYGLLVSLLVIYLSFHFYKNNDRLEKRENMVSLYYRQIAIVLSGILLSLSVSSCMGEGSFYIHKKNFNSIYGGLPVGTYYYTHDHLGSGSLITDENGNEHFRVVYDEYGNIDQHRSGKFDATTNTISDAAGDADKLLLAVKFTGQKYDPETGLYYYNARYYDPTLGLFTTPDTIIDGPTSTAGYNRYSYVKGNPVNYSDPTGHSWFSRTWNKAKNAISKVVGTVISAVVSPVTALYSVFSGTNFLDNFNEVSNMFIRTVHGAINAVAAMGLQVIALNPLVTGLIGGVVSVANGKSFLSGAGIGFAAGLGNLALNAVTLGASSLLSVGNAFMAGYHDTYSHDDQGMAAFFLDHTIGQGTTAVGTGNAIIQMMAGAHFEKGLSKHSNAFILSKTPFSKGNSVGNVASVKDTSELTVLREELFHNWQYRYGGLFNLSRLISEQVRKKGDFPYFTPGTLEEEASNRSYDGGRRTRDYFDGTVYYDGRGKPRPWELRCGGCGRFYR